jgi:hypothetical protein
VHGCRLKPSARARRLVACAIVLAACASLVVPVNYRSIRGTVGEPLRAPWSPPCDVAVVLSPAMVDEGDLPTGVELHPDGMLRGAPTKAGRWHVVIRLPRLQCGDKVYADRWLSLHFAIQPAARSR